MTKTEADPEMRDYAAMDNDIVGGLYNTMSLLEQVWTTKIFICSSVLTQESKPASPTVSY